jgi:ABC-type glycerol-3-phosphate transport system substrate-binding protein
MYRRIARLLAILILGTIFVVPGVIAADKEVSIAMMSGPELDFLNILGKDFTAETGIGIKFLPLGRDAYVEQLSTQLMGKTSTIDVVDIITSLVFGQFAAGGFLEPLDPFIEKAGMDTSYFIPAILDTVTYNGKLYGIPTDGNTMFLVYRKDLIKKPPETWDEYLQTAKKFTKSLNPNSPTKFGALIQAKPLPLPIDFCQYLWSFGGNILDENGKVVIDSPSAIKALQFYVSLTRNKVVPPDANTYEWAEINGGIQESVGAMAVQWNSGAVVCEDPKQSPKVYDKVGTALVPGYRQASGKIVHTPYVQSWDLTISGSSENKDNAFRFIQWFAKKDTLMKYALMGGSPPVADILTDSQVLAKFPMNNLLMQTFQVARAIPKVSNWNQIQDTLSTNLSQALAGSKTPEQALKDAARDMRASMGQ